MASPDNEVRLANESEDVGDKIFHLNNAIYILEAEGHQQYADELRAESASLMSDALDKVIPFDEL